MKVYYFHLFFFLLFIYYSDALSITHENSNIQNGQEEAPKMEKKITHLTRRNAQSSNLDALTKHPWIETSRSLKRRMMMDDQLSIMQWIDSHNEERRKHYDGSEVSWDSNLANYARAHGDSIAKFANCAPEFNEENLDFGENLYWSVYEHGQQPWTIPECVKEWANQGKNYNYERNACAEGEDCAAYLQIVWKNTTKIGCAEVYCPYKGDFLGVAQFFICNYFPPAEIEKDHPKPY